MLKSGVLLSLHFSAEIFFFFFSLINYHQQTHKHTHLSSKHLLSVPNLIAIHSSFTKCKSQREVRMHLLQNLSLILHILPGMINKEWADEDFAFTTIPVPKLKLLGLILQLFCRNQPRNSAFWGTSIQLRILKSPVATEEKTDLRKSEITTIHSGRIGWAWLQSDSEPDFMQVTEPKQICRVLKEKTVDFRAQVTTYTNRKQLNLRKK